MGNDVVGWILLALCVALVNANSGLTALWVLLTALGFTLFLVYAVRPGLLYILKRTRSLQDGPSPGVVALILMIALTSAFFTGVIGIHPIFGAFMAGLICPHDGGFAIKLTEKIEDLVTTLFLPLYFALSGLNTNLGLLNSGIAWAYVVGVTAVAFFAKVIGGSGAARLNGLVWRECFTIGCLMSCKGLVELIVLNIGLQAEILSQTTFTIFVVMALVTTFATTPLVSYLYPPWYQKKLEAWKRGEIDWDTGRPIGADETSEHDDTVALEKAEAEQISKLLVYLRIDSMPGLLALTALFGGANESLRERPKESSSKGIATAKSKRPLEVHAVRLLQLTDRESSVMQVSEVDEYSEFDPVVNTFRSFGRLHNISVSGEVAVVPDSYYSDTLTTRAAELTSDLLILPWSETGSLSEFRTLTPATLESKLSSGPYTEFVQGVLQNAACHAAVFVDSGFGGVTKYGMRRLSRTLSGLSMRSQPDVMTPPSFNQGHHVFMPFFGGADDRVAVRFVLQLMRDPRLTATIVHFQLSSDVTDEDFALHASADDQTRSQQSTGKSRATSAAQESIPLQNKNQAFLTAMRLALPAQVASRVNVESLGCDNIIDNVLERASSELSRSTTNAGDLMVVGRNGTEQTASCFGLVGDAMLRKKLGASLLVVQAKRK